MPPLVLCLGVFVPLFWLPKPGGQNPVGLSAFWHCLTLPKCAYAVAAGNEALGLAEVWGSGLL